MFLGQKGDIGERGEPEATQGHQVGPRHGLEVGRGQVPPGSLWLPSDRPSGSFRHLAK